MRAALVVAGRRWPCLYFLQPSRIGWASWGQGFSCCVVCITMCTAHARQRGRVREHAARSCAFELTPSRGRARPRRRAVPPRHAFALRGAACQAARATSDKQYFPCSLAGRRQQCTHPAAAAGAARHCAAAPLCRCRCAGAAARASLLAAGSDSTIKNPLNSEPLCRAGTHTDDTAWRKVFVFAVQASARAGHAGRSACRLDHYSRLVVSCCRCCCCVHRPSRMPLEMCWMALYEIQGQRLHVSVALCGLVLCVGAASPGRRGATALARAGGCTLYHEFTVFGLPAAREMDVAAACCLGG
jgi:hypothetical protein